MTSSAALLDIGLVSPPTPSSAGQSLETESPESSSASLFPDLLLSATEAMAGGAAPGTAAFNFALPQNCAADESCGQDDATAGDGQDADSNMSEAAEAGLTCPLLQVAPGGAVLPACQSEPANSAAELQSGEDKAASAPCQESRTDETASATQTGYRSLPSWNAPQPVRGPAQASDAAIKVEESGSREGAGEVEPTPSSSASEPCRGMLVQSADSSEPMDLTVVDDAPRRSVQDRGSASAAAITRPSEAAIGEPAGNLPQSGETAGEESGWIPPAYTPIDSPQQITGSAASPSERESATNATPPAYGLGKQTQIRAARTTTAHSGDALDDNAPSSLIDSSDQFPMNDPIGLTAAAHPNTAPLTATDGPVPVTQHTGNQTPPGDMAAGRSGLGNFTALRRNAAEQAATARLANAEVAFEGRVRPEAEPGEFTTEAKQTSRRTDPGGVQSWELPDAGAPATEAAASDDSPATDAVPFVARRSPAYIQPIGQGDPQSQSERTPDPAVSSTREPASPEAMVLNPQARPQMETQASTNRAAAESAEHRPAALEPPPEQSRESGASRVPARDITLQLDDADGRVQVRVVERRGEIHFAVRTPDQQLAGDLRRDLGSLSTRFEEAGLRGETWHSTAGRSERGEIVSGTAAQESQQQLDGDGEQRRRQQQPQEPRDGEPKPRPKEEREEFPWFLQSLE